MKILHPTGAPDAKHTPRPLNVDIDFTDAQLTGRGGWAALARVAQRMGLFPALAEAVSVKRRRRGPSDGQTLWALIASLSAGNGVLSDLDDPRGDEVALQLLGLDAAPSSRRMGEFLDKCDADDLTGLLQTVREMTHRLAPAIIRTVAKLVYSGRR